MGSKSIFGSGAANVNMNGFDTASRDFIRAVADFNKAVIVRDSINEHFFKQHL